MKNRLIYYLIGMVLVTIMWYIAFLIFDTKAIISPFAVINKFIFEFDSSIFIHALASLERVFISVLISIILSLLITLLMDQFKIVKKVLNPIIYLLYPIPKTALLPIVMVIQGLGNESKITLLVLITIFQTIIYLQDGLDNIKVSYTNTLKSLGASNWQMIRFVKLPAVLSTLSASIKVSIAGAFAILFLIETYGTNLGLGYYIQDAWSKINYLDMYFGVVFSGLLCLVIFLIIEIIEQKIIKKGY